MDERVRIKKGIFGGFTVGYDCPNCATGLKSPLDDAGKSDTCPQCGKNLVVPGTLERERIRTHEAELEEAKRNSKKEREEQRERQRVEEEKTRADLDAKREEAKRESELHAAAKTRACPYCGEEILVVAKKCKHCGEFLTVKSNTHPMRVRS